ncbi:MAG: GAF domain-containing protein [Candidatus Rokubacteria bacterium]|nr:GAF domain-containing protein [Candidatus Rokubacteria bacterium]
MDRSRDRLRQELANHFREELEGLRRQWVRQMRTNVVLRGLVPQEIEAEFVALHDACVNSLEAVKYEAAVVLARSLARRSVGRETPEHIIDGLLVLRDVHWQSLLKKYHADTDQLTKALALYSPVANRVLALVVRALLDEEKAVTTREIGQLRTLVKAGMVLSARLSLTAVLRRIANMACRVLNARYAALGVLDGKGGLSQFITAGLDEKTRQAIGALPVGKGILGVLVHEAKPLRLKDLTTDPRAHGFPPNHPPMKSFLGVPIVSKGKVFGNLYLTEKQGAEEFSEEDKALAMRLAAQAAIAIENARLYEDAGLAHELNNPLNTIAGFVEALQQRSQAKTLLASKEFEDFPRFLRMVQGEVDRAASIVRRLLDFARQREPSFCWVDLGRLISESVSLVDRQAALANKRILVQPVPRPIQAKADAQMLQQLLLNLLTNALDALEGAGEVRVALSTVARGRGAQGQHEIVQISVADNGCGIPPENLPKVFDPFFTTKEVGKGTGLGLPICQSIVEQHGGTIEVKSEGIGKGTTVTVTLPLDDK